MKTMFIEARSDIAVKLLAKQVKALPSPVGLFATVQYVHKIDNIKAQLEKAGKEVKLFRGPHSKYPGQILGCSIRRFRGVKSFLFVGDGVFHPLALGIRNSEPVYTFNPQTGMFGQVTAQMMKKYEQRRQVGISKYLYSDRIGILVSTKPGQNRLALALELKKKTKKQAHIFIAETIDFQSLENFPFIECFVNTACPRISHDDYRRIRTPIVDYADVASLED